MSRVLVLSIVASVCVTSFNILQMSNAISLSEIEHSKQAGSEDGEEMVDVETELKSNGDVNLKFSSHGREHLLELTESKKRLADIPINLVGSSDEFTQEVTSQLKRVKILEDRKRGATVSVADGDGDSIPSSIMLGTFPLGKHHFEFTANSSSLEKRKIQVKRKPVDYSSGYMRHYDNAVKRKRRQADDALEFPPISATVELAMIIDYSLWKNFSSGDIIAANASSHTVNLLLYFAHMSDMVNRFYSTMRNVDIEIAIKLVGMVVLTSPDTDISRLIEDYVQSEIYLDTTSTLSRLSSWLNTTSAKEILPPNDHTMLMTAYDLFREADGEDRIVGSSLWATICDPLKSVTVIEIGGQVMTHDANTAAHELGHTLGDGHDGLGFSAGCADANYVMTGLGGAEDFLDNRFLFSCCSQRSFYATISSVGSCLMEETTDGDRNYPSSIDENVATYLPGQIFSADDQCYMKSGTTACPDRNTTICSELWCVDVNNASSCDTAHTAAADGTPCDEGKWCYQGRCIPTGDTYASPLQNCNINDCYTNETRCEEGVNTIYQNMMRCIPNSGKCNGIDDCSDGSDERNCSDIIESSCPEGYVICTSGASKWSVPEGVPQYCAHENWLCDGADDCTDGSDETDYCEEAEPTLTSTVRDPSADIACFSCANNTRCITSAAGCESECEEELGECTHYFRYAVRYSFAASTSGYTLTLAVFTAQLALLII